MKSKSTLDMTTGRPSQLLIRFSMPLLAGNILQQLYNMVDSMVVGQVVGPNALGAVSVGFPIIFLLSSIFMGFGTGASVLISQFFGNNDMKQVQKTIDTIYVLSLVVTIPITIIGVLLTKPLLQLIAVPENLLDMATTYCVIIFIGTIGSFGYNVNSGILQGLGNGKAPLLFLAIASVVNIALDILFVYVMQMGVAGAAIATIVAQIISWIFGIFYINRKIDGIHIHIRQAKMDKELLQRIVRLGIPSAVQNSQFSVAMLIMQWIVNGFGDNFVAGFAAANKIDAFSFMPIQSLSIAITTYVGQNMGAGNIARVKRGVRDALIISVLLCVAITVIVLPFSNQLLLLFMNDSAEVIESVLYTGRGYLYRVMGPMFLLAISFIVNGALRGAGSMIVPMVSSIISNWLARVPFAYILSAYTAEPENMFWCYAIGWALGVCISSPVFLRGRWQQNVLVQNDLA